MYPVHDAKFITLHAWSWYYNHGVYQLLQIIHCLHCACVHQCQVDFQLNMNTAYAALDIKANNYDQNGESYKTKVILFKLNPIEK